jgi:DNA polymerase III sliding clamp (beta) subunit (PCNA family)
MDVVVTTSMRAHVRNASEVRGIVEIISAMSKRLVLDMESDGTLRFRSDAESPVRVSATYPSKVARTSGPSVRFALDAELLCIAFDCAQHKDAVTMEWSGRDTVQFSFTHPSSRSTVVDFPILGMAAAPAHEPEPDVAYERRISAKTYATILHKLVESAATESVRVAFYDDGIDFRTDGDAKRFGVRVWHPTNQTAPERMTCRVPAKAVHVTSLARKIDSVVTIGVSSDRRAMCVRATGGEGLGLTFHITACEPA